MHRNQRRTLESRGRIDRKQRRLRSAVSNERQKAKRQIVSAAHGPLGTGGVGGVRGGWRCSYTSFLPVALVQVLQSKRLRELQTRPYVIVDFIPVAGFSIS